MGQDFSRNLTELGRGDYVFDLRKRYVDYIKKGGITKDKLIAYFDKNFLNKETRKVRIIELYNQIGRAQV